MGIYNVFDVQYDGTTETSLDKVICDPNIVTEDTNDITEYGISIIETMVYNYNAIHEHIAYAELRTVTDTGKPMVYTEGVFSSIFGAIKRFVMKIWDKIKGLFKRFMMIVNSYSKNDKEFANKYRKEILAYHDLSDFTFKGYKWTIDTGKIKTAIEACSEERFERETGGEYIKPMIKGGQTFKTAEEIRKYMEKLDDVEEGFRGTLIKELGGTQSKYSAEEFRKELRACFRHGEDSKEELDDKDIDPHEMFEWLIGSKDVKKTIDTMFKENKRKIDQSIKDLDSMEKTLVNNMPVEDKNGKVTDYYNTSDFKLSDFSNWSQSYKSFHNGGATIDDWINQLAQKDQKGVRDTVNAYVANYKKLFPGSSDGDALNNLSEALRAGDKNKLKLTVPGDVTKGDQSKRYSSALQLAMRYTRFTKECLIDIDTAALQAIKERSRQYKACCIKLVHHSPRKESAFVTESSYSLNPEAFFSNMI